MIEIIPAIDVIDGKCVRLSQGDFSNVKTYSDHPAEVAKMFEANGLTRLHMVDLDGAKLGKVVNLRVLESIARHTNLKIDFGGGIKSFADLRTVINAGATIANVGSIAFTDPEMLRRMIKVYGSRMIMLGADVRDGKIAISGWRTGTDVGLSDFLVRYEEFGGRQAFVTDISKDGLLAGPTVNLYKGLVEQFPTLDLIASGGVSSMEDIDELERIGCHGVIVGKAIYEGKISLEEMSNRRKQIDSQL